MAGYIVDIISVAILVVAGIVGYKKGFVKIVLKSVGLILAFICAVSFAEPAAEFLYDTMFETKVSQNVDSIFEKYDDGSIEDAVNELASSNTAIGKIMKANSISTDRLIERAKGGTISSVSTYIKEKVIRPVGVFALKAVSLIILLIVFLIVVTLLTGLLSKVFSISVIGSVNRFLGLVVGLVLGALIATVLCLLLDSATVMFPNGFLGITYQSKENSFIFKNVCEFVNWTVL